MNEILITEDNIKPYLKTKKFGHKIFAFGCVGSTNEFACNLAGQDYKEGTIVIAEEQIRGKGRKNRTWNSQFGKGLWFSIILKPDGKTNHAGLYSFLAGVSVAKAVEKLFGIKPVVKWPNDLLINEKKFCGILSEVNFADNQIHFIVLGIGINVFHRLKDFPEILQQSATSLSIVTTKRINRSKLLAEILYHFEKNYTNIKNNGFEPVISNWKKRCPYIGKRISVIQDNHVQNGMFEDLADDGSLLMRKNGQGLIKIVAGDLI